MQNLCQQRSMTIVAARQRNRETAVKTFLLSYLPLNKHKSLLPSKSNLRPNKHSSLLPSRLLLNKPQSNLPQSNSNKPHKQDNNKSNRNSPNRRSKPNSKTSTRNLAMKIFGERWRSRLKSLLHLFRSAMKNRLPNAQPLCRSIYGYKNSIRTD